MKVDIISLFPEMFLGPLNESILKRAQNRGLLDLSIHNLRDFTKDRHRVVDDRPFGGGPGMVLKPEPVFDAVESMRTEGAVVMMMAPAGKQFQQADGVRLSKCPHLILLCGSYEGFDERIREALIDETFSIGDYVLTNGALPAMVIVDCVTRLVPGVLGDAESSVDESFSHGLLEYPHYTRPQVFRDMKVPEILMSGNHAAIAKWRHEQAIKRTEAMRPDLVKYLK